MTTIVAALNRIARDVSVTEPSDWITTTDESAVEIRDDFLLETVDDITDRVDWPAPIGAVYSLTGDSNETYAMPSQFKRLQRDPWAIYESTLITRPVTQVNLSSEYTRIQSESLAGASRFCKLTGYPGAWSLSFEPALETTDTLKIHYITDYWMANSTGETKGNTFAVTTDILLLPRRLVETGTIYRWRERKGFPFTDKQMEYEILIGRYQNDNKGRRSVSFGDAPERKWWDVPVPDFIPAS